MKRRSPKPEDAEQEPPEPTDDEVESGLFTDLGNFGTQIERECAAAVLREGSVADAARSLGLDASTVRAHLSELQRRAAQRGFATGHDSIHPLPPGFMLRGISTQYGPSGEVISKWVKTKDAPGDHKLAMLMDAMTSIADAWQGKFDPAPAPNVLMDDYLCVYTMGDPHLGMHAWGEETGQDFDLKIAERNLCGAVDYLVDGAPPAKYGLLIELGDFFHADSSAATTTAGTRVDVDTRWAKVLRVGIRAMRRAIDRMLLKHQFVHVIIEIGNHDTHAAVMLALCLAQAYEREPRVTIDTSPAKFHWYRFGKCLIGVTHGDTAKFKDLPQVMAVDRKEDWGETDHRHFYCGHVHHDSVKEFPGVTVETVRTLAPADAWHKGQGYRSGQDMKLDVWHAEHGRQSRNVIGIGQLMGMFGPGSES